MKKQRFVSQKRRQLLAWRTRQLLASSCTAMRNDKDETNGSPTLSEEVAGQVTARYNATAQDYMQLWSPVLRPMAQPLLHALPLATARNILDIGTGIGALLPDLHKAAPSGAIVGVDLSEGMLRVAQARHIAPVALMNAQQLGIRSESADVALMAFVLFHLPDPVAGLAEGFRVLRRGGMIGVITWGEQTRPTMALWNAELEAQGSLPLPGWEANRDKMNTSQKLADLVQQAGLKPLRTWTQPFTRQWEFEELIALRANLTYWQRLQALSPEARARCLARVREQLASADVGLFLETYEAVYVVARRP